MVFVRIAIGIGLLAVFVDVGVPQVFAAESEPYAEATVPWMRDSESRAPLANSSSEHCALRQPQHSASGLIAAVKVENKTDIPAGEGKRLASLDGSGGGEPELHEALLETSNKTLWPNLFELYALQHSPSAFEMIYQVPTSRELVDEPLWVQRDMPFRFSIFTHSAWRLVSSERRISCVFQRCYAETTLPDIFAHPEGPDARLVARLLALKTVGVTSVGGHLLITTPAPSVSQYARVGATMIPSGGGYVALTGKW